MSYTNSSFVLNYLKLYHSWLYSLFIALTTLTSLKSHSSTKRTHASFPSLRSADVFPGRRFFFGGREETTGNTSALRRLVVSLRLQFTIWFVSVAKHCVGLRPSVSIEHIIGSLGNNGTRRRSKNIFRGLRWVQGLYGDSFSVLYSLLIVT